MSDMSSFTQKCDDMSRHRVSNVVEKYQFLGECRAGKKNVVSVSAHVCRQYQRHNCQPPPLHIQHTNDQSYATINSSKISLLFTCHKRDHFSEPKPSDPSPSPCPLAEASRFPPRTPTMLLSPLLPWEILPFPSTLRTTSISYDHYIIFGLVPK